MLALLLAAIPIVCEGDIVDQIERAQGAAIEIVAPPGVSPKCTLSRPADIRRETSIDGPGDWFLEIEAPRGAFHATAHLRLRGLSLMRADRPTTDPAFGVLAESYVELEDLDLSGFTVGIYVWASVSERGTNANGFRVRDIRIAGSGHAGIIVRGRDANAFHAQDTRVYSSCEHASQWSDLGPCANAVDRSFLGGTWTAMLFASAAEIVDRQRVAMPSFISQGDSQHSIWIGVYCERDQAAAQISRATIVAGGLCSRVSGPGLRIDGPVLSGASITNTQDPARVVTLRLGSQAAPGSWIDYVAPWDTSRPLRRQADTISKCYREVIANQLETGRVCQDGSK